MEIISFQSFSHLCLCKSVDACFKMPTDTGLCPSLFVQEMVFCCCVPTLNGIC